MEVELEAKFLNIDKESFRKALESEGFTLTQPEFLMRRKTMHFPESLNMGNRWGRVRVEADKVTMTIKCVKDPKAVDGTLESELTITSLEEGEAFLTACGLTPTSYQENYRETWHSADKGVMVTLDTWPGLNTFVEIEASQHQALLSAIDALGFNIDDALFGSVDYIYEHQTGFPRARFIRLKEVTFKAPPVLPL